MLISGWIFITAIVICAAGSYWAGRASFRKKEFVQEVVEYVLNELANDGIVELTQDEDGGLRVHSINQPSN
tara:strand:- start:2185 stop:2397 length:213 start_codon:yes stop_codon:yes gene_type:complete